MPDEKSAGSSTCGGVGLAAVFIEPDHENKRGRITGLIQWKRKRAPDHIWVGLVGCSFYLIR